MPIAGQQQRTRTQIICSSVLSSLRGCVLIPRSTAVRIRWCSIMGAATSGTGFFKMLVETDRLQLWCLQPETSKRINTCARFLMEILMGTILDCTHSFFLLLFPLIVTCSGGYAAWFSSGVVDVVLVSGLQLGWARPQLNSQNHVVFFSCVDTFEWWEWSGG